MLIEIAKQQLRKAGWYEGRKIDVSHYEKKFTELGYEFFPAARRFLEEFGDLHIEDKTHCDCGPYKVHINTSSTELKELSWWSMADREEFIEQVGKKIIPVAVMDDMYVYISISEDGKFYAEDCNGIKGGLWAENSDQLWNEYYGEDVGRASWDDIKAGKGRTMGKKSIRQYL
ncbi:MAG: SUKH-3 domain-containing protein [Ruminococcus flavefaciens]|nr:SUKH-3 domain-containing protein [Ruminococcus flavefaciens]